MLNWLTIFCLKEPIKPLVYCYKTESRWNAGLIEGRDLPYIVNYCSSPPPPLPSPLTLSFKSSRSINLPDCFIANETVNPSSVLKSELVISDTKWPWSSNTTEFRPATILAPVMLTLWYLLTSRLSVEEDRSKVQRWSSEIKRYSLLKGNVM